MNKNEAATLVDALAESLRTNPRQFNVQVNVTGYRSTAVGGGTGSTIGTYVAGQLNVSVDSGQVEIVLNAANAGAEKAVLEAVEVLHKIALELRASRPSRSKLKSHAARLRDLVPFAAALVTLIDKIVDLTGALAS